LIALARATVSNNLKGSTRSVLSATKETMKNLLKAIVAGVLIWIAINLVAMGYQPAKAGSVIATVEIVLSLVVAIVACVVLRWP
jgi:RNA 3'-terminal phosphate cyclase